MDETHNYTSAFYILDFNSCQNYSTKFWSFLKYPPTEDIIIISFKNDFESELVNLTKLRLKNEIEWMENYKFINLKSFENCPYILLVKTYLYNEIHGVYFKNIKITTKKVYGKIYKTILKSYFYNFVKNKWKQINLSKSIQLDDMLEDSLGVLKEQQKKKKKNYFKKFSHYEYGLKNKIINIQSNNNTHDYSLNKTFLINTCVEKNNNFSTTHEKGCGIKNLGCLLRTCSDLGYKKRKDNNYAHSYFEDKLYSKNANDLNNFSSIRFKIKNTSLCVCLASVNLFKHIDGLNYYKYLFSKYRNDGKNKNAKSNYTEYWLTYYAMCCKQLYNYFINKLIFETKKKDIHLFNNDIIIFLGFETNILIEKKTNEIKSILNDYSIFSDKNYVILNKKNIIQPKAYSTLIIPGDGAKEFKLIGFRVICNLFIHNNDVIKKVGNHIEKEEIKNVISVSPNFINLNIIHTYQIYQTSFTLSYDCNDAASQNILLSSISRKNGNVAGAHIDGNYAATPDPSQDEKKSHPILNDEQKGKAKSEPDESSMFTTDLDNNNENNFGTTNSQVPISFEENLKKNIFDKWHTNISNIFNKKKNGNIKSGIIKKNDSNCRPSEIKNVNPKDRKKNKDINIVCNNKIENTIPEELYFSILCFDETNNCTIPINLYSFLHIKQNSIFKYFEQNICFKNDKNSIDKKYNFNILRHVYIYPYKGILQPNSKKIIRLHIYIEQMLRQTKKLEGKFIILIYIHNYMKYLSITFKYTLMNSMLFTFISNKDGKGGETECAKQFSTQSSLQNEKIFIEKKKKKKKKKLAKPICTHIKANLAIHNQAKKTSYNLKQFVIVKKEDKKGVANKNSLNMFCSANFEKLFLFLFFTLEYHERKLHTNVDELEEEAFSFLKISHIDNYNIIYSFDEFTDKNIKDKIYNLNFMKKNCLFKEMLKGTREENNEFDMNKINQLILKIEQNIKINKNISINLILFLCEELLYIINKSMIYFNTTDYIRNVYNNVSINKMKQMNIIFYNILKQSPSIFYKNIFLLFISFYKKLFRYFVYLSIHNFYLLFMKKTIYFLCNTIDKERTTKQKVILNYYFHAFLHAFNFFYISFLCYLSYFFLSFLDIQIAFDLAHHILFYM
ncbi:conserved Plasmodium protein, unknown function [Plasmodium chabaudi chabaudi]|uniref:Uncharacterized protein n=1 Tax=Plasmodium chabaudi chabaudi TaxID=31271 RepID=A0A4V0KBS6_PLACU|nr:conserved Plasmodium protein, unknown function [Plasmodium chabaudi chabaudi]VTZ70396.1 conserved Plasmodium protein, unknown function [Plasmodium chabaudi chabaudi]|eukprot:XP_740211.2 conserved Plasmodium protein, unknown function [Plasmodium chabaudi chabaudi]